MFQQRKCTVIFQPHLYTRTRDFADGFAEVLDLAEDVVLLLIYPARELPIEGVNSELILNKMKTATRSAKTLAYIATVDDLIRPLAGRLVVGRAGASTVRTTAAPPCVARTLLLVNSLRIIVLLPLGFLSRASTVISLSSVTSWQ